jgi:FKBP-type peptidyl-prolyl cis-trans isomerase (trigger factor)
MQQQRVGESNLTLQQLNDEIRHQLARIHDQLLDSEVLRDEANKELVKAVDDLACARTASKQTLM